MKTFVFAAPVLEGKGDALRSLLGQLNGDLQSEALELRRAAGLNREQLFLQQTPMGDFAILVWDTEDYAKVFNHFATATGQHAEWFRAQLEEIHGFTTEMLLQGPPPVEILGEWVADSWSYGANEDWALMFPVKDIEVLKDFSRQLAGARKAEFVSTREEIGISRQLFAVMTTPNGPVSIMYGEGTPGWMVKGFDLNTNSSDAFFAWWREQFGYMAAVPMFTGAPMPKVEQLLDLKVATPVTA